MATPTRKFDHTVKTIVVGDSGIGKTSILLRFTRKLFEDTVPSTLGVEFMSKILEWKGRRVELQLWDTAGQELFRSVTRGYYRGSIGAFLVYDITNHSSFEHVREWMEEVKSAAKPEVVFVLIGNKCDLTSRREVTLEEGEAFATELGVSFFEVSAKDGKNIEEALQSVLDPVMGLIDAGKYDGRLGLDTFVFAEENQNETAQSGCC
jgi:small GTP-binding protein